MTTKTPKRGLAAVPPERRSEIASMGGRKSQGFKNNPELARRAGSKGGKKSKRGKLNGHKD